MPYACNLRYLKNDYLIKFYNYSKEKQISNIAAFYHDKKKNRILTHGVECNINFYDASGEIVITSANADRRVKLLNPISKIDTEPEFADVVEIRDNSAIQKIFNYEICKNIVNDINKVLYSFFEISSRQNSIDNAILREIHGNVNVLIQNLLKQNMDFLTEISKPGFRERGFSLNPEVDWYTAEELKSDVLRVLKANTDNEAKSGAAGAKAQNSRRFDAGENYPEAISKLNKLVFKSMQDFLKLSKTFKKTSPLADIEDVLSCNDPVLRTKMLIEMVYNLGDYVLKELHMYEEYKKDSQQKHEKYFYRFAKKYVETVAGTENFDDYKKKLDEWEAKGVISDQIKRAIELELKQAFSTTGNDLELEDKKKTAILEEIFSFPWDKRDPIVFDTKFTKEVFNKNLYGMENVKERIFEYIAKLKRTHKNSNKGFVILISGPPGVGKTTVAQLIGQALKRKTVVINLAGENDTIKLKGSRRTYVDSQPSKTKYYYILIEFFLFNFVKIF
jgi:ATP-dependent Lon protease